MKPSESDPGPCVQWSSVTWNSPSRLKTASTSPCVSTLSASPAATSPASHRRILMASLTPAEPGWYRAVKDPPSGKYTESAYRSDHCRRDAPMLRKEQNDLLTQTGPGTPGGKLFRSYWLPALLAEELPGNDCPPVRVKLLSERLLAFRDSEGRLGLIDEFCAHRGVSLGCDLNSDPLFRGARGNQYNLSDSRPVFEVVESAGGLYIGARRNAENDHYYWRITQWVMPSFTMIPPRGNHSVHGHFWVPIDDHTC